MTLTVREISAQEHLAYLNTRESVSFLQIPAWGKVKSEWGHFSIGWFTEDGQQVGAGLVLTRQVPRIRRYLAYLPEGPDLDWRGERTPDTIAEWLDPMLAVLKRKGAFAVKMGPQVAVRSWQAQTIKSAISTGSAKRLRDIPPDWEDSGAVAIADSLRAHGWRQDTTESTGFGDIQPRYVFQVGLADKTEDDVLRGFNQLWRRNIKKAEKAGVTVRRGTRADLAAFHPVYQETAERDGFLARPLSYFQGMWDALNTEQPDRMSVYLAEHEGRVLAATTMVRVGTHVWYSYGASSNTGREVRPSNAIQWRMITDSLASGARVYDLRGISDTIDPDDPLFGLIQFKLGTGGYALEYIGEWDYALRPVLAWAFDQYMARRK